MNRFIMFVGFVFAIVFSSGCYQSSLHENDPETVLAAGPEVADVAHVDHVMPAQEFEIVADNLRQSTILVAGGDIWHNVAQYRAIASPDTTLQCVRVRIEGDAADISRIAIAQDGLIKGQGILPSGTDTSARICLEDPLDLSEAFQVLVQISQIVSGASVGGEERSVTRTGDRFRIGVESVNLDFEEVEETFSTIWGNEFQIRKTVPSVTRQALSRETLVNGLDQDLFRFQISADNAGMLAIHSIAFELSGDEMTLSNIRMRRGSTDLTPSEYRIVINGTNADSLDIDPADTNRVVVQFLREQTITGSGNVYTLYAATGDLQSGDGLTVAFDPSNTGATGYLHDHSSLDMSAWGSAEDGPVIEAGFIWSDMSEIPHSDASRLMGGSRDWTDGLYVTGQEQLQTLVVL